MKKRIKVISIGLFIILIPIIIGVGVTAPIFKHVTNSNDWIGFWGGYIGSMIGAAVPIYIMNRQNEESKNQSVLPVVAVMQVNGILKNCEIYDYQVDYVQNGKSGIHSIVRDRVNCGFGDEIWNKRVRFHTEIIVKNIGKGPLLDLRMNIQGENYIEDAMGISIGENEIVKFRLFLVGSNLSCSECEKNKLVLCFKNVYGKKYHQTIDFGVRRQENGELILRRFETLSELHQGEYTENKK